MPTFLDFPSTQASTKVLTLWTGATNIAPPTNWDQPGFDDSAWPLSSNPTVQAGPPQPAWQGTTVEAISPYAGFMPDNRVKFLVRAHFTFPDVPYRYYWTFFNDGDSNASDTLTINGHGVGNPTNPLAAQNIEANGYLNPGVDNLVAYAVNSNIFGSNPAYWVTKASSEGWAAFLWRFFIPDTGGHVYSWGTPVLGGSDQGVLGVNDTLLHLTPTAVDETNVVEPGTFVKVASNGKTTLMLTAMGDLYACGDNSTNLFGRGALTASSSIPVPITAFGVPGTNTADVTDISIGDDCAMARTRDGLVYAWGPNAHGSFGRGNTTGSTTPVSVQSADVIAVGKNHAIIATLNVNGGNSNSISAAGSNTYGEIGNAASGADVLSWTAVGMPVGTPATTRFIDLSAGDGQSMALTFQVSDTTWHRYGWGRGVFGSLGFNVYNTGTGVDHIRTSATQIGTSLQEVFEIRQAGSVSFELVNSPSGVGAGVWGDGVPYGGAGDFDGTTRYGQSAGTDEGEVILYNPFPNHNAGSFAYVSGGSQNAFVLNDARAVFSAVGLDALLYTWGYGAYGQMGSGTDPTTNIAPVSINNLTSVLAATVAEQIMFAISTVAPVVVVTTRARSYAQIIGD